MIKKLYRAIKQNLLKREEVTYDMVIFRPDIVNGLVTLLRYAGHKAEYDGRFLRVRR